MSRRTKHGRSLAPDERDCRIRVGGRWARGSGAGNTTWLYGSCNHEPAVHETNQPRGYRSARPLFRRIPNEERGAGGHVEAIARDNEGLANPAGHGNAGLASNFIDLAHAKLRAGGILAMVLPASFTQGHAWANAHALIRRYYCDILVVSIATAGSTDRAFSADTGMAEILVVATRKGLDNGHHEDVVVANLLRRPKTLLEAAATAHAIEQRRLDCNESAGKIWLTETQEAGSFVRSDGWAGIGVRETGLAVFVTSLSQGRLLPPRMPVSVPVPICALGALGRRGFLHRDINGLTPGGEARGPFDIEPLTRSPEYPVLWAHAARRERRLIIEPDGQGRSREGCRERAARLWQDGASRLHVSLDFRLNSQALAACLTEKPSLGEGRGRTSSPRSGGRLQSFSGPTQRLA